MVTDVSTDDSEPLVMPTEAPITHLVMHSLGLEVFAT